MRTETVEKLTEYVNAARPIIYIEHFDFSMIDDLINKVADKLKIKKIKEFNAARGWVSFDKKMPLFDIEVSLNDFLEELFDESEHFFLVLKDIHDQLDERGANYDPKTIQLLKQLSLARMFDDNCNVTIFLVSPVVYLPKGLEKTVTVFDIPLPEEDEILEILSEYEKSYKSTTEKDIKTDAILSLRGLSEFEIRQILSLAFSKKGKLDKEHLDLIRSEKEQIIKKYGNIEVLSSSINMEQVGGLNGLKKYLESKSKIFFNLGNAVAEGVDLPKGILIVGMPGCGKSLTAKATAAMLQLPLLRLDIGKMMGKYVGESEHNFSSAIKVAEAVAPCVLWIDELEKAFAGVGGDGGGSDITTRLFGYFLTWMQEKKSPVYVVATANDISSLPPEFLRRGRFDELFLVELPNERERENIFKIHLKNRKKSTAQINFGELVKNTDGCNGADIENIVKETIARAFCAGKKDITTAMLLEVIKDTKSFAKAFPHKVEQLRKIYKDYDLKSTN